MDKTKEQTIESNHKREHRGKKWIRNAIIVLVADILATLFAFFLALIFRFDFRFSEIPAEYLEMYGYLMPVWCIVTVIIFYLFKLYHSVWSYVSIEEALSVLKSYLILTPFFVVSS